MAVKLKLCEADRAEYGGPEWLVFDVTAFDDMTTEQLDEFEQAMNMSIWRLRNVELPQRTARGTKAVCWLARQLSGDKLLIEPGFDEFEIRPLQVDARPAGGGVNPPDGDPSSQQTGGETATSSTGSTAAAPSAKRSRSSSRR